MVEAKDRVARIRELKMLLRRLRSEELELESELFALEGEEQAVKDKTKAKDQAVSDKAAKVDTAEGNNAEDQLTNDEIRRFSRQLLMPEIGVSGQLQLRNSRVLIVGTGGLGSPCALYLAAMGVGTLGLVDHDSVDASNLHRQIIHTAEAAAHGTSKVVSARVALARLSPQCKVRAHDMLLDSTNALDIVRGYDVVVDASDNAATRYLVNDASVLAGVPLVSGSAVRLDGQLTVYNYNGGPCYRCLFPVPPPPDAMASCGEAGVLGVVPGVIGCLQAMETVKVLTGRKRDEPPSLLLFSYKSQPPFRSVRLRPRVATCAVCGDAPTVTELIDYPAFCGAGPNDDAPNWRIVEASQRVSCRELNTALRSPCLLLDVRDEVQFAICSLPGAVNIPMTQFDARRAELERTLAELNGAPVYAVCRRGNLSQLAVQYIREQLGYDACYDVARGLIGWQDEVDSDFPSY
ncbi:hypothetical protein LPJ58_001818 [Coemansia sp. RSA 1591]|nr:hypothetical protein LPJ58_001818 [Coemansia sp. RSA 1591]KAJ1764571.1 hypothetical protein LPJ69_001765 [Coemansia sp. RSA 1752]KAJ2155779.1 hypothetical protein GGH15_005733 [Coemansia sp. RSA 562]KAJ2284383.1 hypothetical protein GGH14_000095 [Coemansia sp. RSA 370]